MSVWLSSKFGFGPLMVGSARCPLKSPPRSLHCLIIYVNTVAVRPCHTFGIGYRPVGIFRI
jgi:hypothetical protein